VANDACLHGRWLESTPGLIAQPVDLTARLKDRHVGRQGLYPAIAWLDTSKRCLGCAGAAVPPTEYRKLRLQTAGSVSFAAIRRMP